MITELTKFQTEELIRTFELVEGIAAKHVERETQYNFFLCCDLHVVGDTGKISAETIALGKDLIKFWMNDDGLERWSAYSFRSAPIAFSDYFFARLVWLDFILLELYDHLNGLDL
jgi:hypothetical protein